MLKKEVPQTLYCHIGGTGTWGCDFPEYLQYEGVAAVETDMEFETPFGVSAPLKLYRMEAALTADGKARDVLYAPFHGWFGLSPFDDRPSERLFWVLRQAGVKYILADGSGGGINPLTEPGDIIVPEDLIDYTRRISYIGKFTDKIIRMRQIVCPDLHDILVEEAKKEYLRVFKTGIYGCTEAPRFETAAEIRKLYADHCDICGQTMMPEAALARAIGACYASLYLISNYAEGIHPDWKTPIFDYYSDCAPRIGRIMLRAMAAIHPDRKACRCADYVIDVPESVQKRLASKD